MLILAAIAAFVDLVVVATAGPASPVRIVTKPLPAALLAVAAWRAGGVAPRRLALGLALAAAGDEILLRDGSTPFLIGMLCFAAMHVCYICAYLAIARARWLPVTAAALVIAVAGVLVMIAPHAGTFALPLGAYSTLLAAMVYFATNARWRIGLGALAFMISDTLLAFVKFYPGFPLAGTTAELVIVGIYFAAQIAIVATVLASRDFRVGVEV